MNSLEEHVKRILKILVYIEQNIDEELSVELLAKQAFYSPFHFHRIFQAITKEPLYQYIKRLRVEKAAGKLRYTNQSITEIALDATYETPSAFTKAFKQFMGTSPKKYRDIQSAARIIARKINQGLSMIYPDTIEKCTPDLHLSFIRRIGNYMQTPLGGMESYGPIY
jgi:AraC-like DNA-binding protein